MMRIAARLARALAHLIVAEARPDGHFVVLDRAKEMVRLGEKSLTSGRLLKPAMDRGIRTLSTFKSIAERHGVTRFRAVATSAVREAQNGGEFIQRIYDEIGLRVSVSSTWASPRSRTSTARRRSSSTSVAAASRSSWSSAAARSSCTA